jgi:RHS repeat-associated protein
VREYIGGLYERETTSEGLVRHIHYIAGGSGVAAILTDERSASTAAQRTRFIHKDHLGSVDVITDSAGAVVERQSFDAWGRRRTVAYSAGTWTVTYPATPASASSAETHRGFTGHEMLDAVGLVHMGGRVYDPITARFLSPDPFVQSPDNLQNLNRYSYVLNNPLSFTDPSGFFFKGIGKFFQKHWRTAAAIAVGALTGFAAVAIFAPAAGLSTALVAAAGSGFGSAFSGTLLAGGSVGDALRAGIRGGIQALPTAGALYGVDLVLPDFISRNVVENVKVEDWFKAERVAHEFVRIGARGAVRGAFSEAYGGKFSTGLKWSVIPDIAKFGLEAVSTYDVQQSWLNPRTRAGMKYDPHTELGLRTHRVFFGKQQDESTHDRYGLSMSTAEVTNTGATMDGVTSRNWTNEGSLFMRIVERTLLIGSGQGMSHDGFVTSFGVPAIPALGTSFYSFGDMPVINELSNVPYLVPNYLGHAANFANPSSSRVRRK